jgi:S1-C subfamily serine protease
LALLKTSPAADLPTLSFGNSDKVHVGEWVLAVGNPLNLTSTVTAGIVSAKGRNLRLMEPDARRDIYPVESFLQTDAAVNPGNSGGALVNLDGELIGINTAIASQTGSYAGYSFAIPSSIVSKVVDDLREYGRVQRAYLGIRVDQRDPGVRVAGVFLGSGASTAGLQPGDRIEIIDGIPVSSFPALQEQLSKHRPGARIAVQLRRDGKRLLKEVVLQGRAELERPIALAKPRAVDEEGLPPNWGVRLEPADQATQTRLDFRGGLVVADIRPGDWADKGIRNGAVLLRADGQPLEYENDLTAALAKAREAGQRGVLLEGIQANGQQFYAGVPLP